MALVTSRACLLVLVQLLADMELKSGETSGTGNGEYDSSDSDSDGDDPAPNRSGPSSAIVVGVVSCPTVQQNLRYVWPTSAVCVAVVPHFPVPLWTSPGVNRSLIVTLPLPPFTDRLRIKYGMAAEWGNRKYMEDRTTAIGEVSHQVQSARMPGGNGRTFG